MRQNKIMKIPLTRLLPRRFWHIKPKTIRSIEVDIREIKLKQNHFVTVFVTYINDTKRHKLIGRITQNEVTKKWAIDALDNNGGQVAFRLKG